MNKQNHTLLAAILLQLFVLASTVASAATSFVASAQTAQQRARQVAQLANREVVITINEQLVNALLDDMFTLNQAPSFSLKLPSERSAGTSSAEENENRAGTCDNRLVILRETNNTRTQVRFSDNNLISTLAFRASYDATLIGCLSFEGVAIANATLQFDASKQSLIARVRVGDVRLSNAPQFLSSAAATLVRNVVEARFNPVEVLRLDQLGATLPKSTNTNLKLRAKEVRPEITNGELRLRIFYEFTR